MFVEKALVHLYRYVFQSQLHWAQSGLDQQVQGVPQNHQILLFQAMNALVAHSFLEYFEESRYHC